MLPQKHHFDFISEIYSYALQSSHSEGAWCDLLDRYSEISNAISTSLIASDAESHFYMSVSSSMFTPEGSAHYDEHYQHFDNYVYDLMNDMPGQQFYGEADFIQAGDATEIELSSPSELPQVEYLKNNYGVYHRAISRLNMDGRWMDSLALCFSKDQGPLSPQGRQLGKLLLPHMAQAVDLNRTFMMLRSQFSSSLAALDALNIGVFITESSGRVVVKNKEADRILGLSDGLCLTGNGEISAANNTNRSKILSLVERTERTAKGENIETDLRCTVSRPSGATSFLLSAYPLRDDKNEFDYAYRGAAVFVIDPNNHEAISTAGLSIRYGLTDAEAQVAELLAKGVSTDDIADIRNVTPNTIKTQVKSLFKKTGGSRRGDLVRLALSVNVPIIAA